MRKEWGGDSCRCLRFIVLNVAGEPQDTQIISLDEPFLGVVLSLERLEYMMFSTAAYNVDMISYVPLCSYSS